jgi:acid phosphatase (class A)
MKVRFKLSLILLTGLIASFATAQTFAESKSGTAAHGNYINVPSIDIIRIIPQPPELGSLAAMADLETVLRVQASRSDDQIAWAKQVEKDSIYMYQLIVGSWFTKDNLPLTLAFIKQVEQDAVSLSYRLKGIYNRPRPFLVSKEVVPCVSLPKSGSYPSNHSLQAYTRAAVLAEIFPEKREALFAFAHQIAWGRIIGGVHFPTDIVGGRILSEALIKELLNNPKFIDQVNKARSEVAPFVLKKAA